jgi:hypothetical protein
VVGKAVAQFTDGNHWNIFTRGVAVSLGGGLASDNERQTIAKQFYFNALQQIPDKYINDDERQFVYNLYVKVIDALKFLLKYPLDRDH